MVTDYTKLFLESLELHSEKFKDLQKICIELLKSCRDEPFRIDHKQVYRDFKYRDSYRPKT